ncbi:hypothetical protein D3C87_1337520 [compost metagenome]
MSQQGVASRHSSGISRDEQFLVLANELCTLLKVEGVTCRAALPGLPYFSKLHDDKKAEIIEHLQFYLELCDSQIAEGYRIKDSLTFTWRALKKLNLVPPSDMFSYVTDQDVIEIYDGEGRQLYRNFRFFECCSYSLEELYSVEWWNLFDRDLKITQGLFSIVDKVFAGELKNIVDAQVESHPVIEKISEQKLEILYEKAFIGPLFRDKKAEAVVAIVRGRVLNQLG